MAQGLHPVSSSLSEFDAFVKSYRFLKKIAKLKILNTRHSNFSCKNEHIEYSERSGNSYKVVNRTFNHAINFIIEKVLILSYCYLNIGL